MGASYLSDKLESARDSAREAAELASKRAAEAAEAAAATASTAAERARQRANEVASMSVQDHLELGQANAAALREKANAIGNKVSAISVDDIRAGLASPIGASGSASGARPTNDQDGSDSGADDPSYAGSFASRLGFSSGRSPEKQGLLKSDGEAGGGAGGAASLAAGGLATLRQMSGSALTTGQGLARSVGSSIGVLEEEKPREPEGLLDRMCFRLCACCPRLSRGQQLLGFFLCFIFGGLLSLSALGSLPSLLIGNPAPFAFKYTFGNLLSLSSGTFLVGPSKQCRDMMGPERRTASILYLTSLVGTRSEAVHASLSLVSSLLTHTHLLLYTTQQAPSYPSLCSSGKSSPLASSASNSARSRGTCSRMCRTASSA